MDLKSWFHRHAAVTPFVATAPGGTAARLAVEAALREVGLHPTETPTAANLLIVAGVANGTFAEAVTRIENSIPLPRIRIDITEPASAATALAKAAEDLRSGRSDEPSMEPEPPHDHHVLMEETPEHNMGAMHHDTTAHGHSDHMGGGQDDHGDGGHSDHMGGMHEHGGHGMGMELPGGLAMADRANDRDGLRLDVLTVALGPVLEWWPAGLVVSTRMQGDIVSAATVSVITAESGEAFWLRPWLRAAAGERVTVGEGGRWRVARRLDSAATVLAVAGWGDAAVAASRLRDEVLGGELRQRDGDVDPRLRRFVRRVSRSRVLSWSLRGVGRLSEGAMSGGPLGEPEAVSPGLTGDVHDRLLALLEGLDGIDRSGESRLDPDGFAAEQVHRTQWIIKALPALLTGAELSEARLIVASLAPDLDVLVGARAESELADG